MNYGLYLSATALQIQEYRQAITANNLANVNTTSFKRDRMIVGSRPPAPVEQGLPSYLTVPILDEVAGGLRSGGGYTDFRQGSLARTGKDLDVALRGEGFFRVLAAGETRYTRDGRLDRDAEGFLVTAAGRRRVLDDADAPIHLAAGKVAINERGVIEVDGQRQGRLGVVRFSDPDGLRKAGDNTYVADAKAEAIPTPTPIVHGHVEASGVDPTRSLVDMITAQRTYEASAKMIQFADNMLGKAVNEIARFA